VEFLRAIEIVENVELVLRDLSAAGALRLVDGLDDVYRLVRKSTQNCFPQLNEARWALAGQTFVNNCPFAEGASSMSDDELTRLQEQRHGKRASLKSNGDFLAVETMSGRGILIRDPETESKFLGPEADDLALGLAVVAALADSRFFDRGLIDRFLPHEIVKENYEVWVSGLVARFSYKNRRNLFSKMTSCSIKAVDGDLIFSPSRHLTLEGWEDLPKGHAVVISIESSPAEIGAAARLALSRCKV
jgi:hypothetical protein